MRAIPEFMNDHAAALDRLFRERREVFLRVLTRRLGNRDDAEEVLQDAFIHFDRASAVRQIDNPDAYLMRTALNLAVDRMRQNLVRSRRDGKWFEAQSIERRGLEFVAPEPAPDNALIGKDEVARMGRVLGELSPTVRTAFILHKIRGLSHDETAKTMGLSKSTIEKHIMKAMKFLLDKMAD